MKHTDTEIGMFLSFMVVIGYFIWFILKDIRRMEKEDAIENVKTAFNEGFEAGEAKCRWKIEKEKESIKNMLDKGMN